jgi:hypothetical protein
VPLIVVGDQLELELAVGVVRAATQFALAIFTRRVFLLAPGIAGRYIEALPPRRARFSSRPTFRQQRSLRGETSHRWLCASP